MSITALKHQLQMNIPKRIRIEQPEIFEIAENVPTLGLFFKWVLFLAYFFALLSVEILFFAYQPI